MINDRMDQQQEESSSSISSCRVPPGFRFHPTEEELVGYYLARKVASPNRMDLLADIIQEVDLYRIEPWDLQERCNKHGGVDDQTQTQTKTQTRESEWYFFSYKDRKYPSGTRTNRATAAGFWKATGRDKPVLSSRCGGGSSSRSVVIGMRKTLVFYRGRAPNGRKTEWIMHEYRLQSNEQAPAQEEGWVVCRAFQKPIPNQLQRPPLLFPTTYAAGYYDDGYDHHPFLLGGGGGGGPAAAAAAPPPAGNNIFPPQSSLLYSAAAADDDDDLQLESKKHLTTSILPQLESPTAAVDSCCSSATAMMTSCYPEHDDEQLMILLQQQQGQQQAGQAAATAAGAIDWSFLDTLLATASQLHDYPSLLPSQ